MQEVNISWWKKQQQQNDRKWLIDMWKKDETGELEMTN